MFPVVGRAFPKRVMGRTSETGTPARDLCPTALHSPLRKTWPGSLMKAQLVGEWVDGRQIVEEKAHRQGTKSVGDTPRWGRVTETRSRSWSPPCSFPIAFEHDRADPQILSLSRGVSLNPAGPLDSEMLAGRGHLLCVSWDLEGRSRLASGTGDPARQSLQTPTTPTVDLAASGHPQPSTRECSRNPARPTPPRSHSAEPQTCEK